MSLSPSINNHNPFVKLIASNTGREEFESPWKVKREKTGCFAVCVL
jgi:hypothetical protein